MLQKVLLQGNGIAVVVNKGLIIFKLESMTSAYYKLEYFERPLSKTGLANMQPSVT